MIDVETGAPAVGHTQLSFREGMLCTTSLTTDSRSDHVRLPVATPLWIPAFAGMTG